MKTITDPRPSPIAGQWYPADPRRLAASVDAYLEAASLPPISGEVAAVMAPHAGHRYSGATAAHAFAALRGRSAEVVAVVSPMHHPYPYPLLTSAHSAYQTPLGAIPIDREIVASVDQRLRDVLGFGLTAVPHDPEHSVEIELPFLQRALQGEFRLAPIMVRDQSPATIQALGLALGGALRGREALLVASTDLSHFYPQAVAETLDAAVLARVEAFDPLGLLQIEREGLGYACGRGAVAAVLWAAEQLGAGSAQVLHYATSAAVTGDYSKVVGYAAAAITRKPDARL